MLLVLRPAVAPASTSIARSMSARLSRMPVTEL